MSHAVLTPPPYRSVVDILRTQAREQPDKEACVILGGHGEELESASYEELDRRARAVAAMLQGVAKPGERALILCPTGVDFVVGFFGAIYAGLIAVPVGYPDALSGGRKALARLEGIVRDAEPAIVLTTAEIADLPGGALGGEPVVVSGIGPELAELWREPDAVDDGAPAFLQYTSGSTSEPKGVALSHANILDNLAAITSALRVDTLGPDGFRAVSWLPLFHDMGLTQLLATLHSGGRIVLMAPSVFLMRPMVWLETIARERAFATSAPNFAYDLCVERTSPEQRAALDLSSLRLVLNGAEPIRPETLDRFADAFAVAGFKASMFMPCYGMAEVMCYVSGSREPGDAESVDLDITALELDGRIVFAPEATQATEASAAEAGTDRREATVRRVVGCGRAAETMEVLIVDPETRQPCAPDRVGEIWLSGGSVSYGYWGQAEATAARFGGRLAGIPGTAYLRTGDLGFFADDQLFILGRMDDVIIIDGRNHFPQDIETTVEASHPALSGGRVAAFAYRDDGHVRLGVAAETNRRARPVTVDGPQPAEGTGVRLDEVTAAIRRSLAEEHGVAVGGVALLRPGGLPRTTSGKVQRRLTGEMFVEGALKAW
nr:AMP-binding protein [Catenulispora sp.]